MKKSLLILLIIFAATFVQAQDSDSDDVEDRFDICDGTKLTESVPQVRILPNRYALMDGDTEFDTKSS